MLVYERVHTAEDPTEPPPQRSEAWRHVHILLPYPHAPMDGIFTYIWVIFGVNVGTYSIHGAYGIDHNKR